MTAQTEPGWHSDDDAAAAHEAGATLAPVHELRPSSPEPASWERYERTARLFTVAALASCWLGPLGIALALAALTTGLLARTRRRNAGATKGTTGLVLAFAVIALVVSVATTPVIVGAGVENVVTPLAETL